MIYGYGRYNGEQMVGIIDVARDLFFPLKGIYKKRNTEAPRDMNELIDTYDDDLYAGIYDEIKKDNDLEKIPLRQIKLLSPIPYPKRSVFCLGKNYKDHIQEMQKFTKTDDELKYPIYFSKMAYPCTGPDDIILRHANATSQLDYEAELVVIIGKGGINIRPEDVEGHIFGYTIGNDVSARDLQKRHNQWLKGKSLSTHCPIGPWIVHKSLIPFPVELDIKCFVNGELRQDSNTKHMIFDIPTQISILSQGMELVPGDIIMTGTPAGVGMGFDPPRFLQPKDKIECVIEKIGKLTNFVSEY